MTARALVPLLFFCLSAVTVAQERVETSIDLRGRAAFRIGDDDVWRSKFIDELEADWNFITVPGAWEEHGFPLHDGFAWYRIRFQIPESLREDSLLLVMSGVDDADETFLNGVLVGKSGTFPPNPRSELHSLRVYPLPRFIREEYNLLAVRVFDRGDEGGITGGIFRIIRAGDIAMVLDEIVDAPAPAPSLYISNGVMASAISGDSAVLRWSRPRMYDRIAMDLPTQITMRNLRLGTSRPQMVSHVPNTGIVLATYADGMRSYWYHPRGASQHVLVVAVRGGAPGGASPDLAFTMERPAWLYAEHVSEKDGERTRYHLLVYNSCCVELAERDLDSALALGEADWGLDAEMSRWTSMRNSESWPPSILSDRERTVYSQSIVALLQARVEEGGGANGQILSGLEPQSTAQCIAGDHLWAAQALAAAGLTDDARRALAYVHTAEHRQYQLHDVYGKEEGVGFPYMVSPVPWDGSGNEWRWTRVDEARFRHDGLARYIMVVEELRILAERQVVAEGRQFNDSAFIAPYYHGLIERVADVLLYRIDSTGFSQGISTPWGPREHAFAPDMHQAILAMHALDIASSYAERQGDGLRAFLYRDAVHKGREQLRRILLRVAEADSARALAPVELRVFHPLLADAVTLGVLPPDSPEAAAALDIVERSFAIEDTSLLYNARPDGDWFERQARPLITLQLAAAYATQGRLDKAEALFGVATDLALRNHGLLPELIDPLGGSLHGAMPSTVAAAAYILAAERIVQARLRIR